VSDESLETSHSEPAFRLYGIGLFRALVILLRSRNDGEPRLLGIEIDLDLDLDLVVDLDPDLDLDLDLDLLLDLDLDLDSDLDLFLDFEELEPDLERLLEEKDPVRDLDLEDDLDPEEELLLELKLLTDIDAERDEERDLESLLLKISGELSLCFERDLDLDKERDADRDGVHDLDLLLLPKEDRPGDQFRRR